MIGIRFALCINNMLGNTAGQKTVKDDGKDKCIAATGADGKTIVVVGEGVKVGEEMDCQDRGNMTHCEPIANYMTCSKDDGHGNCTEASTSDGKLIVVINETFARGDKMTCTAIPGGVHCVKLVLK
jgi:hypothetical protein